MNAKILRSRFLVVIIAVIVCMSFAGKAGADYDLILDNLAPVVTPGGGFFTFDILLANPSIDYVGWQFGIGIVGQSGQDGVDFNILNGSDTTGDLTYVFNGNSFDFQLSYIGGDTNTITGSDLTNNFGTVTGGGLLAHVQVDYDATAYGFYDIFVTGTDSFNFLMDGGAGQHPEGRTLDNTILGSVAVAPEPISSTLFLVGGATLGLRRFRRKK